MLISNTYPRVYSKICLKLAISLHVCLAKPWMFGELLGNKHHSLPHNITCSSIFSGDMIRAMKLWSTTLLRAITLTVIYVQSLRWSLSLHTLGFVYPNAVLELILGSWLPVLTGLPTCLLQRAWEHPYRSHMSSRYCQCWQIIWGWICDRYLENQENKFKKIEKERELIIKSEKDKENVLIIHYMIQFKWYIVFQNNIITKYWFH